MANMQLYSHIKQATNVLVVCHKKPDGDTLGSGFAVYHLCRALSIPVAVVSDSELPACYAFMEGFDALNIVQNPKFDLVIAVDCAEADRMGMYAEYLKNTTSINIDHHKTNEYFCKYNYVVGELSSACELMYDIMVSDGVFDGLVDETVVKKIASSLYVGLSTDTGHFMHSSVTPKTFRTAADLAQKGIDTHALTQQLYRNSTIPRKKLLGRALGSMRFYDDNTICVLTIATDDYEQVGATSSDNEGIIDHGIAIGSVLVAVAINQYGDKLYKVSFRSKGADVARIAGVFGGGGHMRAAGCMVAGYYEDVVDKVVKAVRDELG